MSQFRTTADILDEILQKAGEPTNGNSPYETLALTYANKVHHAIIAGGSIFNIEVNEPWLWARARFPIVLELQAGLTGTASFSTASTSFDFSAGPSGSVENWHIRVQNKPTTYKITHHTASNTAAHLDSAFVDASGSYAYDLFKIDYEIYRPYIYIDSYNDRINFQETGATVYTATLTHGTYTPSSYINHVAERLQGAGSGTTTYGGSFDSVTEKFTATCSVTYKLLGASGADSLRSALPTLGFDVMDHTAATTSRTSTYRLTRIARLIEPFRLFTDSNGQSLIYSSDPIRMQEDHPLHSTRKQIPTRFAALYEGRENSRWIRFNGYPDKLTKISLDYIEQPLDLQDNTASTISLPRQDTDVLIHGAAAYIAFDKSNSKFQGLFDLCKAGLETMRKRNRDELFRTGQAFGQIVPREDSAYPPSHLRYGYTSVP